jgi:hypothetical protein
VGQQIGGRWFVDVNEAARADVDYPVDPVASGYPSKGMGDGELVAPGHWALDEVSPTVQSALDDEVRARGGGRDDASDGHPAQSVNRHGEPTTRLLQRTRLRGWSACSTLSGVRRCHPISGWTSFIAGPASRTLRGSTAD